MERERQKALINERGNWNWRVDRSLWLPVSSLHLFGFFFCSLYYLKTGFAKSLAACSLDADDACGLSEEESGFLLWQPANQ